MEKFGLVKLCQYIDQHGLNGSISYCSGEGNQYPAVSITDFSIRPVRRTNIICEDEAISELLEKRPDLTN